MSTTCSGERQPLKRTATESTHRRNDDQAIKKKTGYGIIYLSVAVLVVVVVVALKSFVFSVGAVSGDTTSLMLRTSEVSTTSTSNVEVKEVEDSISLDSTADTALMNNNNNVNKNPDLSNLMVPSTVGRLCRGWWWNGLPPRNCVGGLFCNFDVEWKGACESCPFAEIRCYHIGLPYQKGVDACVRSCDFTVESCDANFMCSNNGFCNFDYGSKGYCEPCPIVKEGCFDQDLPEDGALACAEKCAFRMTKPPAVKQPHH